MSHHEISQTFNIAKLHRSQRLSERAVCNPDFKGRENEVAKRRPTKLVKGKHPHDFFTIPLNKRYEEDNATFSKKQTRQIEFQCTFFPAFGKQMHCNFKRPIVSGKQQRCRDRQSLISRLKPRSESSLSQKPIENPLGPIRKLIESQNQMISFSSQSARERKVILPSIQLSSVIRK